MLPRAVNDLKTFVPARDAELSKKLYTDLGFTINWSNPEIFEIWTASRSGRPSRHLQKSLLQA